MLEDVGDDARREVAAVAAPDVLVDRRPLGRDPALVHRDERRPLVREVLVERPGGVSRRAGKAIRVRPVIAVAVEDVGRRRHDTRPPSAARYARLLDGVLDALGIERAVLVGNSIGGATALRYAATHPERVAGLVLENPSGLDRPDRLSRRVIDLMVRFFAAGSRRAAWFPR